jgi:hypothetical protein
MSNKKNWRKNYFVWHTVCCSAFGTKFALAAILAVSPRRLPFWQLFGWLTVIIVNRPVWPGQSPT